MWNVISLGVEPSYILMCSGMLKFFSKIVSSKTVKDWLYSCLCEFWLNRSVYWIQVKSTTSVHTGDCIYTGF